MTWQRVGAWVATLITGLVLVAEVAVVTASGTASNRWAAVGALVIGIGSCALGSLVVRRHPRNAVGTLLCAMGALWAASTLSDTYVEHQGLLPAVPDAFWLQTMTIWIWMYVAVALLMMVFPDGRLLSPRWRLVAVALVVVGLVIQALMPVLAQDFEKPYRHLTRYAELSPTMSRTASLLVMPAAVVLLCLAGLSAWLRFRRADAKQRAQLKWFATVVVVAVPLTLALSWVGYWVLGTHSLAGYGIGLLYAGLPAVTALAILQHDLYDVDRAFSASVVVGVLSVALLVVFGLASAVAGLVLGRNSSVVAAGVTAGLALLAIPLFGRVRGVVDRAAYPLRHDALAGVARLRAAIDAGTAVPEALEGTLRLVLRDPALRVDLTPGTAGEAVRLGGRSIGAIVPTVAISRKLLREVASASAPLVEMARLRLEATTALRESEASRARLQQVGYEERRRLERDLHDGVQQRLVSLGINLRLAQRHLADDSIDIGTVLEDSVAQLAAAVTELRQLAHGIRPSCLDDGLLAALSALAATVPVPVDLAVPDRPDLPDAVVTTAYFVVAEAVGNALKHGSPTRIGIRVETDGGGGVRVRIEDDGSGGATITPGAGLAGVADRVNAAGGRLTLDSPLRHGTTVEAILPCVSC